MVDKLEIVGFAGFNHL